MSITVKIIAGTEYTFYEGDTDYQEIIGWDYRGPATYRSLRGDYMVNILDLEFFFKKEDVTVVKSLEISADLTRGSGEIFKFMPDGIGNGFDIHYLDGKSAYRVNGVPALGQLMYAYQQALHGVYIDNYLSVGGLVPKYITNGILWTLWETVEYLYRIQKAGALAEGTIRHYDLGKTTKLDIKS